MPILVGQGHYNSFRYEYDSGLIQYLGEHPEDNADTSWPNWVITKFYYDGDNNLTQRRVRETSWDARASGW